MSKLDEIEEYVGGATEGPWSLEERNDGDGGATEYFVGFQRNPKGWWDKDSTLLSPEDATFIAKARTDMPLLLAVAKASSRWLVTWGGDDWTAAAVAIENLVATLAALEANRGQQ